MTSFSAMERRSGVSQDGVSLDGVSQDGGGGLLEGLLSKLRRNLVESRIPEDARSGRLLDIGCGAHPGFLLETRFEERFGIDRLHVDRPDEEDVGPFPGIELRNFDVEVESSLPYDDQFFDIVTMLAVFEHIEPAELPRTIAEIHRVLKPGGRFILTTPSYIGDKVLKVMALFRLIDRVLFAEHKDVYTHTKIKQVFEKTSFPVELMELGHFELYMNVWAVAEKPLTS